MLNNYIPQQIVFDEINRDISMNIVLTVLPEAHILNQYLYTSKSYPKHNTYEN